EPETPVRDDLFDRTSAHTRTPFLPLRSPAKAKTMLSPADPGGQPTHGYALPSFPPPIALHDVAAGALFLFTLTALTAPVVLDRGADRLLFRHPDVVDRGEKQNGLAHARGIPGEDLPQPFEEVRRAKEPQPFGRDPGPHLFDEEV